MKLPLVLDSFYMTKETDFELISIKSWIVVIT